MTVSSAVSAVVIVFENDLHALCHAPSEICLFADYLTHETLPDECRFYVSQIQRNIEDRRRMGNCADRNKVHAGLCHRGGVRKT